VDLEAVGSSPISHPENLAPAKFSPKNALRERRTGFAVSGLRWRQISFFVQVIRVRNMADQFTFEKLDVYQRAFVFSQKVLAITKETKSHYSWCDQFSRAATSVVLNIAEGAGRWHAKEKANFY
jgi:hypothetical protein